MHIKSGLGACMQALIIRALQRVARPAGPVAAKTAELNLYRLQQQLTNWKAPFMQTLENMAQKG